MVFDVAFFSKLHEDLLYINEVISRMSMHTEEDLLETCLCLGPRCLPVRHFLAVIHFLHVVDKRNIVLYAHHKFSTYSPTQTNRAHIHHKEKNSFAKSNCDTGPTFTTFFPFSTFPKLAQPVTCAATQPAAALP